MYLSVVKLALILPYHVVFHENNGGYCCYVYVCFHN